MLIQIENINLDNTPKKIGEILDRALDVSFNSSLMREMRAINFVSHIIDHGFDDDGRMVRTNIHYIGTGDLMNEFNNSSRMNVSWDWLTFLRDDGRAKAEVWIKENFDKIGKQSTCDINNIFM